MPDLTDAELEELEMRLQCKSDPYSFQACLLIVEVRHLRAENAELRKRVEWRESFKMKENP